MSRSARCRPLNVVLRPGGAGGCSRGWSAARVPTGRAQPAGSRSGGIFTEPGCPSVRCCGTCGLVRSGDGPALKDARGASSREPSRPRLTGVHGLRCAPPAATAVRPARGEEVAIAFHRAVVARVFHSKNVLRISVTTARSVRSDARAKAGWRWASMLRGFDAEWEGVGAVAVCRPGRRRRRIHP